MAKVAASGKNLQNAQRDVARLIGTQRGFPELFWYPIRTVKGVVQHPFLSTALVFQFSVHDVANDLAPLRPGARGSDHRILA